MPDISMEDIALGRIPPATACDRDFSSIASMLPLFDASRCTGCMTCVTECPDSALLAKVIPRNRVEECLRGLSDQDEIRQGWARTTKYYDRMEKQGREPALFGLIVDPRHCKGCGECVEVCESLGYGALRAGGRDVSEKIRDFFRLVGPTPPEYINEKSLVDMMLAESHALIYTGGAGSCAGCGQATAIRMMLAATGFVHGPEHIGVVASTGCNSVYGSTFPNNPFRVAWTSSLFENAPAVASGIRLRWDQEGRRQDRLWVIGGDGAMYDIGLASLSRLLASSLDVKVLVLDTQVYSNTGGQASTATFPAQDAEMSRVGSCFPGKAEDRKDLAMLAVMHGNIYVAQTSCAYPNHFYRAVMDANTFPGPALVNVYAPCQPEHGIQDCASAAHAKLAVECRAFPLLTYDPRRGESLRERFVLVGNPAVKEDWYHPAGRDEPITFIDFARAETRFSRQFDAAGAPSEALRQAASQRLRSWRRLQELAGLR